MRVISPTKWRGLGVPAGQWDQRACCNHQDHKSTRQESTTPAAWATTHNTLQRGVTATGYQVGFVWDGFWQGHWLGLPDQLDRSCPKGTHSLLLRGVAQLGFFFLGGGGGTLNFVGMPVDRNSSWKECHLIPLRTSLIFAPLYFPLSLHSPTEGLSVWRSPHRKSYY